MSASSKNQSQSLSKEVAALAVGMGQACDWFCPPLSHRNTLDNTGTGLPRGQSRPAQPQYSTVAKIHLCHPYMAFICFLDPKNYLGP